jgi:hypothetical protein
MERKPAYRDIDAEPLPGLGIYRLSGSLDIGAKRNGLPLLGNGSERLRAPGGLPAPVVPSRIENVEVRPYVLAKIPNGLPVENFRLREAFKSDVSNFPSPT